MRVWNGQGGIDMERCNGRNINRGNAMIGCLIGLSMDRWLTKSGEDTPKEVGNAVFRLNIYGIRS